MKKYNHAIDVAFEVLSDNDTFPTREEILDGLQKRYQDLLTMDDENFLSCFDVFDTYDTED
jgi:hypothetical protein